MRVCATNKKLRQAHLNDAPSRRRDLLLDATSLSSFGFPSLSTHTLSSMVTRRRLLQYRLPNGIFDVKDAPRTGRPVVENVDKITEIIKVHRHVNNRSFAQELKIDHKTVLNHLRKVGFKKKFNVWVPHQLTPKNMMNRISIYEALAKRNEINPFLKQMVTEYEKWVTYDNIVRKRSWSKHGEAA
ncbi:histone-lysine N-methyltransferase SETMAR [Trichonephila clavipes]|nr:histone-lysine N-methyltransferase SETMAR [Trichonephila clavipes]